MIDITIQTRENIYLAIIKGRIDSYTSPDLSEKLDDIIQQGHQKIILNLCDVNFVSSAGLRVFIDIQKKCKKDHMGELLLVQVPERVFETLELAGFAQLFNLYDDVDSAIAAF